MHDLWFYVKYLFEKCISVVFLTKIGTTFSILYNFTYAVLYRFQETLDTLSSFQYIENTHTRTRTHMFTFSIFSFFRDLGFSTESRSWNVRSLSMPSQCLFAAISLIFALCESDFRAVDVRLKIRGPDFDLEKSGGMTTGDNRIDGPFDSHEHTARSSFAWQWRRSIEQFSADSVDDDSDGGDNGGDGRRRRRRRGAIRDKCVLTNVAGRRNWCRSANTAGERRRSQISHDLSAFGHLAK